MSFTSGFGLESYFREFWNNKKTYTNFENLNIDDLTKIILNAKRLKESEFYKKNKHLSVLRFLCRDSFTKKKFDYQIIFWIYCIDPELQILKIYFNNKAENKNNEIIKAFGISEKYIEKLAKIEVIYRRNFNFDVLEKIQLSLNEDVLKKN